SPRRGPCSGLSRRSARSGHLPGDMFRRVDQVPDLRLPSHEPVNPVFELVIGLRQARVLTQVSATYIGPAPNDTMSHAAPTLCMKVPMSDSTSAMRRFRNVGARSGDHRPRAILLNLSGLHERQQIGVDL